MKPTVPQEICKLRCSADGLICADAEGFNFRRTLENRRQGWTTGLQQAQDASLRSLGQQIA